jgi:hypothetical protein
MAIALFGFAVAASLGEDELKPTPPKEATAELDDLPFAIHLKAARDGSLAEILFGSRSLGVDPRRLRDMVRELLDGTRPEDLHTLVFELDCDPDLRLAEMHRALRPLVASLPVVWPQAKCWFFPEVTAKARDRNQWLSIIRFSLESPPEKAASAIHEEHVWVQTKSGEATGYVLADGSKLDDARQLVRKLAERARQAQSNGERVNVPLHADEHVAVRFWLRILSALSESEISPGLDRFDLIAGPQKSSVPLRLHRPAKVRAFHPGEFDLDI